MNDTNDNILNDTPVIPEEVVTAEAAAEVAVTEEAVPGVPVEAQADPRRRNLFRGRERRPRRSTRTTRERVKPEFDQKTVDVRRVVRVVAGGRRFSLSACIVAGNRKGMVGVGVGKALDTALAIEKAYRDARKNMVVIPLTKDGGIPHDVLAKEASTTVLLMPAPGRGLVAGGATRIVLELAGVSNISAKVLSRSKNSINNARATVKALSLLRPRTRRRDA